MADVAKSDFSQVTGLWRRGSMMWPDGRVDDTTRVLWLQTRKAFADIRVPLHRDLPARCTGFADLSDDQLIGLATSQGFAGTLDFDGRICRWHRVVDFHPAGGPADEAVAHIDGDTLIESGIEGNYVEDWHREADTTEPLVALHLADDSSMAWRDGFLVVAGDHFIELQDRDEPLPRGTDLAELVREDLASGDRSSAEQRLGMRISAGRRAGGQVPWQITLSTLPWYEGKSLFDDKALNFDPDRRTLKMIAGDTSQLWALSDTTIDLDQLATWFAPFGRP